MLFYICLSLLLCNAFASPKWHLKSSLVRSLVEDYMKKEIKNELEDELKDSPTFCSSLPDGDYVDPDTCAGFIKCSGSRTFKFPCPASGLYYDPETNRCEYNTRCIDGKLKTLCAGKQDGNYRYPTGCASYISCYNGMASRGECTEGLAYDQYQRKCVAKATARCTIKGTTETCTGPIGVPVHVKGEKWYDQFAISCLQHVCTGQDTYRTKDLCPSYTIPDCSNGSISVNYTPQGAPSFCTCEKVLCCANADCTTTSPPWTP